MVIAWMGTISFGIIMARHYKQVWSDSTWCGVKIWFAVSLIYSIKRKTI